MCMLVCRMSYENQETTSYRRVLFLEEEKNTSEVQAHKLILIIVQYIIR